MQSANFWFFLVIQGKAATYLRCGGQPNIDFVENLLLFATVKEFCKSTKIDKIIAMVRVALFFDSRCWVLCSNTAMTRNTLKFAGVPQTNEMISATSGPKFTILWGHVEEILRLNKFFSDCRHMPYLRRYSPTKLCDGAQMAIFGDFFASCICSEPRAAHFRPAF